MFFHSLRSKARGLALILAWAGGTMAQTAAPAPHNEVVIKNAVVMTVTHGNIQNGSVYIKDGKIAAVGQRCECALPPPP